MFGLKVDECTGPSANRGSWGQGTGHTLSSRVFQYSDDWQSDGQEGCGTAVRRAAVRICGLSTAHARFGRTKVGFAPCLWGAPERERVAFSGCALATADNRAACAATTRARSKAS
jgi:hypothetical protein